jgi:hypothetical protein
MIEYDEFRVDNAPKFLEITALGREMDAHNLTLPIPIETANFKVFKIFKGSTRIGFAYGHTYLSFFFLQVFYIDPKFRRQNAGAQFHRQIEETLLSERVATMTGITFGPQQVLGFWLKLGYEIGATLTSSADHAFHLLQKPLQTLK